MNYMEKSDSMLVMELGFLFDEMRLEMIETQRMKMDESRSVLVWDRDLSAPFGSVTVPFLHALGNRASSFWNEGIPDPDQIGSDDGWSSTWAIESGWGWRGTAKAIHDNQHIIYISLFGFSNPELDFRYDSFNIFFWNLKTFKDLFSL